MATQVVAFPTTKTETFFGRQAWKILLGMCLTIGFFGLTDMAGGGSDLQKGETVLMHSLTGMSWNDLRVQGPQAANLIEWKFRTDGASLFTLALLSGLVLWTGFRRGGRWSWVALWAPPLWMALTVLLPGTRSSIQAMGRPCPLSRVRSCSRFGSCPLR